MDTDTIHAELEEIINQNLGWIVAGIVVLVLLIIFCVYRCIKDAVDCLICVPLCIYNAICCPFRYNKLDT